MPVTNRSASAGPIDDTVQARTRFVRAPPTAESATIRRGGNTSGRFRMAEPRAPVTKPSWTEAVSQAAPVGERLHAVCSAGSTAVAENQSVTAENSATDSHASWTTGRWARDVAPPAGSARVRD